MLAPPSGKGGKDGLQGFLSLRVGGGLVAAPVIMVYTLDRIIGLFAFDGELADAATIDSILAADVEDFSVGLVPGAVE